MTDLAKALETYSVDPILKGNEEASTQAFLDHINDEGYNIGEDNLKTLSKNPDAPLIETLDKNLPYVSETDRVLSFVKDKMSFIKKDDGNFTDETYLSRIVSELPSAESKFLTKMFKRPDLNIKTLADVDALQSAYAKKRISKYYRETFPEEEATKGLSGIANTVSDTVSDIGNSLNVLKEDIAVSADSANVENAFVDVAKVLERSRKSKIERDKLNKLIAMSPEKVIKDHKEEAIKVLGFGDSGIGQPITDTNLLRALQKAKENHVKNEEVRAIETDSLIKRIKPALDGTLDAKLNKNGANSITSSKTASEAFTNTLENPFDVLRMFAQQGRNLSETLGATVAGTTIGGFTGGVPGAIAGGASASAKVEYDNALGQQLAKDFKDYFAKNKIEPTPENIKKTLADRKVSVPFMERAKEVAKVRAAFTAASSGLGIGSGVAKPLSTKIGAAVGALASDVTGGKVEADVSGDKYTSANTFIDALAGTIGVATVAGGASIARAKVKFKDTPNVPKDVIEEVAVKSDNVSDIPLSLTDQRLPYSITPAELESLNLVKKIPADADPDVFIQDKANWNKGDINTLLEDTDFQVRVISDISNKIAEKAIADGLITKKTSSEDVANFILNARNKGYDLADFDRVEPVSSTPILDVPELSPVNSLFDTPQQARYRNAQRSTLQNEAEFRRMWEADTKGKGKPVNVDNASIAFYRSLLNTEDDLRTSYAKAAKAYKTNDAFKRRLTALSRENIPVLDDHARIGETGKTTEEVSAILEDTNSHFYKELSKVSKSVTRLLKESVRNGNVERTRLNLIELGNQSKDLKPLVEAIDAQLFNKVNIDVKTATADFNKIDSNKASNFYFGEKAPKSFNTLATKRQALQYAHGIQLRRRFGNEQDVKQIVPNNNKIVSEVLSIMNNATSAGEALHLLANVKYKPISRAISDLVEERTLLESGKVSPIELRKKVANSDYSLISKDVDNSILNRSDPAKFISEDQFAKTVNDGVVIATSKIDNPLKPTTLENVQRLNNIENKAKLTASNDTAKSFTPREKSDKVSDLSGRRLHDIETDDTSSFARSRLHSAVKEVSKIRKELGLPSKLTPEQDNKLHEYLTGKDQDYDIGIIQLGEAIRKKVSDASNEIISTLEETKSIHERLGVNSNVSDRIDVIRAHLDDYLTRSYSAFDDYKKWLKQATNSQSDLFTKAVNKAIETGHAKTRLEAVSLVKRAVTAIERSKGDINSFVSRDINTDNLFSGQASNKGTGSRNVSALEERVTMPSYVRELLDESVSGINNFENTIYRQAKLLGHISRDNEIVNKLSDMGVVSNRKDAPDDFTAVTAQSPIYNKFSALHDVAIQNDVIDGLNANRILEEDLPSLPWLTVGNKLFKTGVLTLNPASYGTQLYGSLMVIPHLGKIVPNLPQITDLINDMRAYKRGDGSELEFMYDVMAKVGINDSAHIADLQALLNVDKVSPTSKDVSLDKLISGLNRIYGTPDRMIKTLNFFSELSIEKLAVREDVQAGRLPADTDVFRQAVVNAADKTADFFPTPQRSFNVIKKIRTPKTALGVLANMTFSQFLTFTYEIPRTLYRTIESTSKDITGNNSVRRSAAYRTIGGYISLFAGMTVVKSLADNEFATSENQELLGKFAQGNESIGSYIDNKGNWKYTKTEYTNPYSMITNTISTWLNPNLTLSDKINTSIEIGVNNTFGGNFLSSAYDGFSKEVSGSTNYERAPEVAFNMLASAFPLPAISHGKKIFELHAKSDRTESEQEDLEQLYWKFLRMDEVKVEPAKVWKNAGESAKKFYDTRSLRKTLLANDRNADIKDFDELMTQYADNKLEAILKIAPKLIRHRLLLKDTEYSNYDSLYKALSAKSGISKGIWLKAMTLLESDIEPTVELLGLGELPSTNSSFIKEQPKSVQDTIEKNLNALRVYRANK